VIIKLEKINKIGQNAKQNACQNGPKWRKQKTKKIDRLEISEFKKKFNLMFEPLSHLKNY
jgi:hypothetical protein